MATLQLNAKERAPLSETSPSPLQLNETKQEKKKSYTPLLWLCVPQHFSPFASVGKRERERHGGTQEVVEECASAHVGRQARERNEQGSAEVNACVHEAGKTPFHILKSSTESAQVCAYVYVCLLRVRCLRSFT